MIEKAPFPREKGGYETTTSIISQKCLHRNRRHSLNERALVSRISRRLYLPSELLVKELGTRPIQNRDGPLQPDYWIRSHCDEPSEPIWLKIVEGYILAASLDRADECAVSLQRRRIASLQAFLFHQCADFLL
jgi:hypothetical protein